MRNNLDKATGNHGKAPSPDPNHYGPRSPGLVSVLDSFRRTSPVLPPIPDLNLTPGSQTSNAGITAGSTSRSLITPKLEVKEEPIDDLRIQELNNIISLRGGSSTLPKQKRERYSGDFAIGSTSRVIGTVPENSHRLLQPPRGFADNRVSTFIRSRRPPQKQLQRPNNPARVIYSGPDHRELVKRTRRIYESLRLHLTAEDMKNPDIESRRKSRTDIKAANLMKDRGLWLNQERHLIGAIPGVEIGDLFFHRVEMCVLGLHGQLQRGIDYLTAGRSPSGEPIATSIVVSGGYDDNEDTGDVLVYSGHGGQDRKLHSQCEDQELKYGNLAMERTKHYDFEVRVIRGFKYENNVSSKVYIYDGLYKIVDYKSEKGKSGFEVYKFKLVRIEGQPRMGSEIARFAERLKSQPLMVRPTGYISLDISNNTENVPVYLYNDLDGDQEPLRYKYVAKSVYAYEIRGLEEINRTGCYCNGSCNENCLCARKNGGEFAYDDKGNLLRGKPVVFECGVSCKCSPSCKNRVTQRGLRHRLEVFRASETRWGVRTLDIIQAGAFICEYVGTVLTKSQAEIFSIDGDGIVYPRWFAEKWGRWGDLSPVYPDYTRPDYPCLPPLEFGIDLSLTRNVAAYISHCNEPNVMVQFVLYDQESLMYPRVMLFALENISPLTELSLDYGLAAEVN